MYTNEERASYAATHAFLEAYCYEISCSYESCQYQGRVQEKEQDFIELCAFVNARAPEEFKKFLTTKYYDKINIAEVRAHDFDAKGTEYAPTLAGHERTSAAKLRKTVQELQNAVKDIKIDNCNKSKDDKDWHTDYMNGFPKEAISKLDEFIANEKNRPQKSEPTCVEEVDVVVNRAIDYLQENNPVRLLEKYIMGEGEVKKSEPLPAMPYKARSSEYYNGRSK